MDTVRIDDWLSAIPSKYTRKTYKSGSARFYARFVKGKRRLDLLKSLGLTRKKIGKCKKEGN